MLIAALVSGFGRHVEDLSRAAATLGIDFRPVRFPRIVSRVGADELGIRVEADGLDLTKVDGVLVRMMPPGSLEQVVYRMDALHHLESLGIPLLNPPRAVEVSVDKYLSLARLERAGLPVPKTWTGELVEDALTAFDDLGGDVVIKPIFGSEGRGLMCVSDRELAWRTFHTLHRIGAVIYMQERIQHEGQDVRVFVLDGRILGAMRRHARVGEWRTNVATGGRAERIDLESSLASTALAAALAVGARMAGVDIVFDPKRNDWLILEVNAVPGWNALAAVTRVDVASEILRALAGSPL